MMKMNEVNQVSEVYEVNNVNEVSEANSMNTEEQQSVNTDSDIPQPFATVLDLINEHGYYAVLEAVSDESEEFDEDTCMDYRKRVARIRLELEQLLERMDDYDDGVRELTRELMSAEPVPHTAICPPVEEVPSNGPAAS